MRYLLRLFHDIRMLPKYKKAINSMYPALSAWLLFHKEYDNKICPDAGYRKTLEIHALKLTKQGLLSCVGLMEDYDEKP